MIVGPCRDNSHDAKGLKLVNSFSVRTSRRQKTEIILFRIDTCCEMNESSMDIGDADTMALLKVFGVFDSEDALPCPDFA